jgi:hypothetical protein
MEVHIAQKLEEALLSPAFSDLPLEVVSRIFARNGLQTLSDPRSLVTFVLKHEDENAGELLRSAPLGCVDRAVLEQLVVAKRVPSRIDGNVAFSLILQAAGELDRLKRELAELDAEVRRFQGVIGTARPVEAEQFSGARAALREAESEKERLAGRVKPMAEGESGAAVEESPTSLQQFVDDRRARVAELTREYRLLGRPDLNQGILRRLRRELRQNPIGTAVDAIVTPPEAVVPGHGCEHILDEGTFWARGTTEVNGFRLNFRESRVRVDGFALRTNTLGCDKLALPKSFSLRGSVNGSDWDVLFEVTEVNGFGWAEQLRKFQWVSHTDKWYQWIEYNQTDAVYPYTDRGQVVALADFDLFGDIRK